MRKAVFSSSYIIWILLVYSALYVEKTTSLAGRCYANGRIYRNGETTVTRENNNKLYKCTCLVSPTGRAQRHCSHSKEDAHIFIADGSKISKIALGGGFGFETNYIQHLPGIVVSVGVDISSDLIFWSDVSNAGKGIYKARLSDGSRITKIISKDIYEPNGLAVDWLSKNIYWTDAQLGAIFVAKNDGRMRTRLISGLPAPRCIAVLPREGLMFWGDQTAGTIETARMDGTGRRIVIAGLIWPNQIAIDHLARRIYWVDAYKRRVESCGFDGRRYSRVFDYSFTGYNLPAFGLSLFDNHLYFGVWNDSHPHSSMFSITKIGQHFKPVIRTLGSRPMGMVIINNKMQSHSRKTNPCWSPGSSVCSHLCLPTTYEEYRCACPSSTGLVLSRDGRTCKIPDTFILYTSIDEGTVMIVSTDNGADKIPSLLAQSHQPSAVAFDPVERIVYWSDVGMNKIYRKKLGDLKYSVYIEDGIGTVDGLCVDYVNRHLYFTNMGWNSINSSFHQIEMVELSDVRKRKVLTAAMLNKPRDILIDQKNGWLYVTDWGKTSKIVRSDLDGSSPFVLPVKVENPNGIALKGYDLYIVDSHVKSSVITANGTVVYGKQPSLIKYDTRFTNSTKINGLNMEIPFGLTHGPKNLYVTDWGLAGIYTINLKRKKLKEFIVGVQKPTGIVYASLKYQKFENECTKDKYACSDICVSIASVDYTCMCTDRSATALSGDLNCVEPDSFILVADGTRIVMKSFDPVDDQQYVIIRTFDLLSNIVALTYDPITNFVYWADNGRQRILRKNLGDKNAGPNDFEIIYTDIGRVEGMALDPGHRLLYWTDAELGTIEMLSLTSSMTHATVSTQLPNPRAIALNPHEGLMYWTEEGDSPMVMSSSMSGKDIRSLVSRDLKWPNALYYDKESDRLWIADGGTLVIMSVPAVGGVTILDHRYEGGIAAHIYGLWKDPTTVSSSMIYSDWVNKTVVKGSEVFMDNLEKPSQIYIKQRFSQRDIVDRCLSGIDQCSHICVPNGKSFVCLCPDHLLLANDMRTCLTEEQLHRMTSTTLPPPTTTLSTVSTTTPPWADIVTSPASITTTFIDSTTAMMSPVANTMMTLNTTTVTLPHTIEANTEIAVTTVAVTKPEETTIPKDPYFDWCDQSNTYAISLPDDSALVNITPALFNITAYDGHKRPLAVKILGQFEETVESIQRPAENLTINFIAVDRHGTSIICRVQVAVIDQTPPEVDYCPNDMEVESYAKTGIAFVNWEEPKFTDNSGRPPRVIASYYSGSFAVGLYNITYRASDDTGNTVYCIFHLAVLQKDSACHKPHAPRHSQLTCSLVDGVQKCLITCDPDYTLSLADPYITCQHDMSGGKSAWVPYLDSGICSRPMVANVEQDVMLQYPCPCRSDVLYYDRTRNSFGKTLRSVADCKRRKHKLGLCNNRKGGKLHVDCINNENLNVTVTVDLDNLRGIKDTKQVKDIVKRSSNRILEMAVEGRIVAEGYAERKNYTVNTEALAVTRPDVVCDVGFIAAESGCVECPKGTYSHANKCEFCKKDSYQDKPGRDYCTQCPASKQTFVHGATDISYCVIIKEKVDDTSSRNLIIAGAVGGFLIILAIILISVCVYRRKKNNKYKKEQERIRKEREAAAARKRKRSARRRAREIENAKNKSQDVDEGNNISASTNKAPSTESVTDSTNPTPAGETRNHITIDGNPKNVEISDSMPEENLKKAADDATSSAAESAFFTDEASDSVSVVSSEPPLKSALKKPTTAFPPPESFLDDDTSTVISASTITPAQLKRANIKTRSSSLDYDGEDGSFQRGRSTRRSASMGRPDPNNMLSGSNPIRPQGSRRSLSFDRSSTLPGRMFPPRFNNAVRGPPPSQKAMMMRMPQQVPGLGVPVAPMHNYSMMPLPHPRPSIYGTYAPRRMPPPRPPIYPTHVPRHPLMANRAGTLPGRPGSPYNDGYWNEPFDNSPEWATHHLPLRGEEDMRQPHRMMTLPRASMLPRYGLPNGGVPGMMPYPRMQPPPPYYS